LAEQANLREMANLIANIKKEAEKLKALGSGINCIEKNVIRMSAILKMMELDVSDAADILGV